MSRPSSPLLRTQKEIWSGNLVGAVQGHELATKHNGVSVEVSFAKGHQLHKVEVEDDLARIADPGMFQERILKYLPKH